MDQEKKRIFRSWIVYQKDVHIYVRIFTGTPVETLGSTITNKSKPGTAGKISSSDRQITFSLILVCVNYLLLTTPYYCYFYMATLPYFDQTPRRYMDMHIVFGFNSIILVLTNSALNFFIYMIFGRKYRRDLFSLFRC